MEVKAVLCSKMPWEIGKNIIVTTRKIFGINCLFFKEWFSVAF
jgi:hypothetical protein